MLLCPPITSEADWLTFIATEATVFGPFHVEGAPHHAERAEPQEVELGDAERVEVGGDACLAFPPADVAALSACLQRLADDDRLHASNQDAAFDLTLCA